MSTPRCVTLGASTTIGVVVLLVAGACVGESPRPSLSSRGRGDAAAGTAGRAGCSLVGRLSGRIGDVELDDVELRSARFTTCATSVAPRSLSLAFVFYGRGDASRVALSTDVASGSDPGTSGAWCVVGDEQGDAIVDDARIVVERLERSEDGAHLSLDAVVEIGSGARGRIRVTECPIVDTACPTDWTLR